MPDHEEWMETRREALAVWRREPKTEHVCNDCGLIFRQFYAGEFRTRPRYRVRAWRYRRYRDRCPRCLSRDIATKLHANEQV